MKYQSLFSEKKKEKKYFKCCLPLFKSSMLKVIKNNICSGMLLANVIYFG